MSDQEARDRDWGAALAAGTLPAPVAERLAAARDGRAPWMATMTPSELLLARSHGCRPIAAVSGNCWYAFGRSWTEGHVAGWAAALARLRGEAVAAGANAVVDVQLRTVAPRFGQSMDFTLVGTAVRIDGLAPCADPPIATVPALAFVRLLEMGIVPTGIAVGAAYEWLGGGTAGSDVQAKLVSLRCQPIDVLTAFWERIRRTAIADLERNAATLGNGVLAHTQFGQLLRREVNKQTSFLGRHIVIGTVVDTPPNAPVPHEIGLVVDLRDRLGRGGRVASRTALADALGESEGGI